MVTEMLDLFEGVACPVIVTDNSDVVIYKNSIARKNFSSPRKGSSIKTGILANDINIVDGDEHGTAIHTLANRDTIYRRALVFRVGAGNNARRVWLFDIALQMIRPEMARTLLYNASNALLPLIEKIVETQASGSDILGEDWSAPVHKVALMLHTGLKNLYFASTHTLCSAEELCRALHEEVLSKLSALGIVCKSHRISNTREPVFVDYYTYTQIFIRFFLMILNRNSGNIIDINYTKDEGMFRTEFCFAAKLYDPVSRHGRIADLGAVLKNDTLNIAMIDSLIKSEEGAHGFYEVRRTDVRNLSLTFEIPVKKLPGRRLRQEIDVSDITLSGFIELLGRIIRDF